MLKLYVPPPTVDYLGIYTRMSTRLASELGPDMPRIKRMQLAFVCVNIVNLTPEAQTEEALHQNMFLISGAIDFLGTLTPQEFADTFPPIKTYDGDRYGMKDYYYAMKAINDLPPFRPIGDAIRSLLCEYYNYRINTFMVKFMTVTGALREMQTGKSMIEEFFGIKPHYLRKDPATGKEYMLHPDGKTSPVAQKLRIVK